MFDATSRYRSLEVKTMTVVNRAGGLQDVSFILRRFIPPANVMTTLVEHTATQSDRIDTVSARYLGDPLQFWRVCDANTVRRPDELTEEIGRAIRIGLPQG